MPHYSQQRKQARHTVQWSIHALGGSSHLIGAAVCDVSGQGLFVRPSGDEPLPKAGSRLRLTVFPHGMGQGVSATGAVRWAGHSHEHGCRGLGILVEQSDLFSRLSQSAAAESQSN